MAALARGLFSGKPSPGCAQGRRIPTVMQENQAFGRWPLAERCAGTKLMVLDYVGRPTEELLMPMAACSAGAAVGTIATDRRIIPVII
jgi:hypothetical protein